MKHSRLLIALVFVSVVLLFTVLSVSPGGVSAESKNETTPISVHAAGQGNSSVNFADGRDLETNASGENAASSAPFRMVSADFDSDGVPDLITADTAGILKFYRGKNLSGDIGGQPFAGANGAGALNFSPDFLANGDFNADGRQDLLAAANGANSIILLSGDGRGHFSVSREINLGGRMTAAAAGEIGCPDGQTDLAVAVTNGKINRILIFENPEGAFSHQPEIFKIKSPVTALAVGELDGDSYGDVAAAGGNLLTVVHGRGQAYSLDLIKDAPLKRPAAIVETSRMPFAATALAIGKFTGEPGDSLAVLTTVGAVQILESPETSRAKRIVSREALKHQSAGQSLAPGFDALAANRKRSAVVAESLPQTEEEAAARGIVMADSSLNGEELEKYLKEKAEKDAAEFAKLPAAERARRTQEKAENGERQRVETRSAVERDLSAKPGAPLAAWSARPLVAAGRLAGAANFANAKITVAHLSGSGRDELILLDPANREIQLVVQPSAETEENPKSEIQNLKSEVVSFAVENGAPIAVVPMRLNADAISDLVVLRENASEPTVVPSAPAQTYTVNSTGDDDVCESDGECTLRGAIRKANNSNGADFIGFNIAGDGVKTITPTRDQLPLITDAVTIDATTQPGYAGTPLIEIKGVNLTGAKAGLGVNASSCVIRGFVINEFTSAVDEEGGDRLGGDGIVIFSTDLRPNAGNNIVEANYIGTNATGSVRRGNEAAGVLIYDSNDNLIGGTTAAARNVISGNQKIVNEITSVFGIGLQIRGGERNRIQGNYIGTNASGASILGNYRGVAIGGKNNELGGDAAGAGNVISGNGGVSDGGNFNRCGGQGVVVNDLIDLTTGELLTDNNAIRGNRVGTNAAGTVAVANCEQGITSTGGARTIIGSVTPNGRNLVSGNDYDAIWCGFGTEGGCYVWGNDIGTDATGTKAIPNTQKNGCVGFCILTDTVWIVIQNNQIAFVGADPGTSPGGSCTGFCNLIAGNATYNSVSNPTGSDNGGVLRSGFGLVAIFNNYIGTTRDGQNRLSNFNGVEVYAGTNTLVGDSYQNESGAFVSLGNLLSGNKCLGATVSDYANGSVSGSFTVRSNLIGTDAGGSRAIPNSPVGGSCSSAGLGVAFQTGFGIVGGENPVQRNIISGNGYDGLSLGMGNSGGVIVFNNYIGLTAGGAPLGNGRDGVSIDRNSGGFFYLGDAGEGKGNQIKNNVRNGVSVLKYLGSDAAPTERVRVVGNSISDNGALGIDLANISNSPPYAPDGVTPNDCVDADAGANGLQNYPELYAPVAQNGGGTVVPAILRSLPSQNFTVDFYANNQLDPTKYGEGEIYLGAAAVTTDTNGFAAFNFVLPQSVSASQKITATATDANGSTSEFSCAAGECTTGSVQDAIERAQAGEPCAQPIVVNVNTDDRDANVADGVCDTDTSVEGLQCSLRAAIEEANARSGSDSIYFNIPGGGVQTIAPASGLPEITDPVSINGKSQPGYADTPLIKLDGAGTASAYGLAVSAGSSKINGLTIVRFDVGIALSGFGAQRGGNTVTACFLGIDAGGGSAQKQSTGIELRNTTNGNHIGGTTSEDANVISNNVVGVSIDNQSHDNIIYGNRIGTNKAGTTPLPNDYSIIVDNSSANQIGGDMDAGEGNLINSNVNDITLRANSQGNRVEGNLIGTDASGQQAFNGNMGVYLYSGAAQNVIGGATAATRNVIAGHKATVNSVGILFGPDAGDGNKVVGNYIGVSKNLERVLPNYTGIGINADNQIVGSENAGDFQNVIGGSTFDAIYVHVPPNSTKTAVNGNQILNNQIGASAASSNNFGNTSCGIELRGNVGGTVVRGNTVGNSGLTGIRLVNGAHDSVVSENFVGTGRTGAAIPNPIGIAVRRADSNRIENNVVAGNGSIGIALGDGLRAPYDDLGEAEVGDDFTEQNTVTGNKIGTNADGDAVAANGRAGIVVAANARSNRIGGNRSQGDGNRIGGNASGDIAAGIFVGLLDDNPLNSYLPQNNRVEGNLVGINISTSDEPPILLPNTRGIVVRNAKSNFIGGGESDKGNVVGGNQNDGIALLLGKSSDNIVQNNFVGVTQFGLIAANGGNGISVDAAPNTTLDGNTVGGNAGDGILVANLNADSGGAKTAAVRRAGAKPNSPSFGSLVKVIGNALGVIKKDGIPLPLPNLGNGLHLLNVQGIFIGSDETANAAAKNIISANKGAGVLLEGANSTGNVIGNSIVGTDEKGAGDLGNGGDGIKIVNAPGNTVGKVAGENSDGNLIVGNALNGINVDAALNTTINGNTVGGNGEDGILVKNVSVASGGGFFKVIGNTVGSIKTDSGSLVKVPNLGSGVHILDSVKVILGAEAMSDAGEQSRNVISGNKGAGILIEGANSSGNVINNAVIGTDETGATDLGNDGDGIKIVGAPNNVIGKTLDNASLGNVISGNRSNGISIRGGGALGNFVTANYIGLIKKGIQTLKLPNGASGISILDAAQAIIGGTGGSERNYIGGNDGAGIVLSGASAATNRIVNNAVGTDDAGAPGFGNGGDGVLITDQSNRNQVGGAQTGAGNTIISNGGAGVRIDETAGIGNLVDPNEIFGNTGLGIEIGATGVLPNDLHDADEGANRGQNYPELNYAVNGSNQLIVNFRIDSAPGNSTYGANGLYVEFFNADASGQGKTFLGSAHYAASDYNNGTPQFKQINLGNINALNFAPTDQVTATATDADGNTSEFTPTSMPPTAAGATIAGRVFDPKGKALSGAVVKVTGADGRSRAVQTNSFGNFRLTDIGAGETVVISVSAKRFKFAPQIVSVTSDVGGLVFTAQ